MPRFSTDRETLEREAVITFLRRGGPGGQHQNKTETAVRLHHPPSGVTLVVNSSRSQSMNREEAFRRLVSRLEQLNHVERPRKKTRPSRAAVRRRLDAKKRRSEVKKSRGRVDHD